MRHLLSLADLTPATLRALLDSAQSLRPDALRRSSHRPLRGLTVANLFFEPSTRTRASFQLAAERLGADVLNFEAESSSTRKGETLVDTLRNLEAMGASLFVVRHAHSSVPAALAAAALPGSSVVSAGDGQHSHPTQGLLDMLTIRQHKGKDFSRLTVTIVGDIRHSRVARSDAEALRLLNVGELRLCGPQTLLPDAEDCFAKARIFDTLDAALDGCDVVMMLRLQRERMDEGLVNSLEEYYRDWGLSPERLALAKPDAIVLHPGPMNRGVEIADAVADGPQSVILEQVSNGVAVRMAVLEALANA
ncbi:MAG TPA: aspartate carbamoyltransferase catalytic subunit [Chiayiivirga sp.]|nr:aspartate carbamoyltransferase catalytic subunit [Chiayiivirga sp.]